MEKSEDKPDEIKDGFTRSLLKANITYLNLSGKDLLNVDIVELPINLIDLNLSHNKLETVPAAVMKLRHLKLLNLSFNKITNFNDTPEFCHTLVSLNLANNNLNQFPLWIWSSSPQNLSDLDLSCNNNLKNSLNDTLFNTLLQYKTSLTVVKVSNCSLQMYTELLATFHKVKKLDLGSEDLSRMSANILKNIPCKGMNQCIDLESLNLRYTWLYTVNERIETYEHLVEIDLSDNELCDLPKEFCNLANLETCVLSCNQIFHLPEDIIKLKKLTTLIANNNRLYMLPENIFKLPCLVKLDVYTNSLYEIPDGYEKLEELDLAQNYFEEPESEEYENMKNKLRSNLLDRCNGRRFEIENTLSRSTKFHSEDEECESSDCNSNVNNEEANRPPSSIEDWDSDDYWEPGWNYPCHDTPTTSPWEIFLKRVMAQGNFCPVDSHTVPIDQTVKYEKLCNPQEVYESDGQFDDYSSDDS